MATILVMDDEAPVQTLILAALESVGHKAMEAANGHGGLALYRQRPADLVIADILMPGMKGLHTLIELMQEFLDVKVIVVSGAAEDQRMLDMARLLGGTSDLTQANWVTRIAQRCAIRIGTLVHLPSGLSLTSPHTESRIANHTPRR